MIIESNKDMKVFLDRLARRFEDSEEKEPARLLAQASQNFITTNSEFLGEARAALSKILTMKQVHLEETERADIQKAIGLIDGAFRKANGL